ncbi:MAG: sigma-70 family RNA polymerase sigma factor [Planctomycetota bacterium]
MSDFPATRQSLLLELARRSDAAWSEFLEVYEATIYRRCRALGLQDADARDVTQEVLAAVHQRIPTWDYDASRGSFRGWLLRTARNISVDRIADRARPEHATGGSQMEHCLDASMAAQSQAQRSGVGSDADEFSEEFRRTTLAWALEKVRGEVRELTWRAFVGTTLEGRGAAEVAEELGASLGSVYTAKCRVVARIQARVAELEDGA